MRIFISYAREDAAQVEALYQRLQEADFGPWMDTHDLLPGQVWRKEIESAIKESDFVLVCLSQNSVQKRGTLQREIRLAMDLRQEFLDSDIYLIPVRLEPCQVPDALGQFQWVDFFEDEGWPRLRRAIEVGMERMGIEAGSEATPAPGTTPDLTRGSTMVEETVGEHPYRLRLVAPDGYRFEAEASGETLVGQLQRDFLEYWSPLSSEGKGRHRYNLAADRGSRILEPASTLGEAGVGAGAELCLVVERLGPDSAVGLTLEDDEGERFTTTVRLDTPVVQLLDAFSSYRHRETEGARIDLASDPSGNDAIRSLKPEQSLFEQGVGNDSLLRISYAR